MDYKTGTLVHVRGRDWVVLPSEDPLLMRLKPLGGREDDVTGIYLPLMAQDGVKPSQFNPPTVSDLGTVRSARLLFDASRLSLRSAAGPFRCAAKLGFRPRSYQMVPLIMALKQQKAVRLLIADDVGVGKTIEAILIVKELLERREIKRFAVLCPPHLCDQWKTELKEKFNIEAVIMRTGTQASLDKKIPDDRSVYDFYPYQVISIDYIKTDSRYAVFASRAPELVIVDEAHTCAKPQGAHQGQQLRHRLVRALAEKSEQNLVLMTATPHSGKEEEFRSLLGLLKPEFENGDWESEEKKTLRNDLAAHFVQWRRGDIKIWMDEKTPFPTRLAKDIPYTLTPKYQALYDEVLLFASQLMATGGGSENQKRFRYWSALALLRGIMSSPAAGATMLENRAAGANLAQEAEEGGPDAEAENPHFERMESSDDELPTPLLERTELKTNQKETFSRFAASLRELSGTANDAKASHCARQIKEWVSKQISPVVFCRYIETAKYLAACVQKELGTKVLVECITSEDPDEVRRERIEAMAPAEGSVRPRVLVATDCLSEGINLQHLFDAVLHYDLPWNPNRLEQREGRVDRFGQTKENVYTALLFGQDNPMDQIVLKVLYNKAKIIRSNIGVSIPFPEDSKIFLDTIFKAVLAEAEKKRRPVAQMELFSLAEMVRSEEALGAMMDEREKKETSLRTIFAQRTIQAQDIEKDLARCDEAVGRPETVYRFVHTALKELYGINTPYDPDTMLLPLNATQIPASLSQWLPGKTVLSFSAPVPQGTKYVGRNHDAVEALCQTVLSESLNREHEYKSASRAAVAFSLAVEERCALYVLRARHVIEDKRAGGHLVAEEILLYGYRGLARVPMSGAEVETLMSDPKTLNEVPIDFQKKQLERELQLLAETRADLDALAHKRAEELIGEHERYYVALGESTTAASPRTRAWHGSTG